MFVRVMAILLVDLATILFVPVASPPLVAPVVVFWALCGVVMMTIRATRPASAKRMQNLFAEITFVAKGVAERAAEGGAMAVMAVVSPESEMPAY